MNLTRLELSESQFLQLENGDKMTNPPGILSRNTWSDDQGLYRSYIDRPGVEMTLFSSNGSQPF